MRTLYFDGEIVTNDTREQWPEALVLEDDRVVLSGSWSDARMETEENTELCDLLGKRLVVSQNSVLKAGNRIEFTIQEKEKTYV